MPNWPRPRASWASTHRPSTGGAEFRSEARNPLCHKIEPRTPAGLFVFAAYFFLKQRTSRVSLVEVTWGSSPIGLLSALTRWSAHRAQVSLVLHELSQRDRPGAQHDRRTNYFLGCDIWNVRPDEVAEEVIGIFRRQCLRCLFQDFY